MVGRETATVREIVTALIDESRDHLAIMREALAWSDIQIDSSLRALRASRKRLASVRNDGVLGPLSPMQ